MSGRSNPIGAVLGKKDLRQGYAWLLGVVIGITLLKGFRLPNLYSATHFVFNYSSGFVRRGLVGEVMQRVFGDAAFTYGAFLVFAVVLFVLAAAALSWGVRRALTATPEDLAYRCALLVFVSSPALVFFVHMVGYLDYIGLIAVLGIVLWAPRTRSRYALFYLVAACACVFAFIHEILAVMFMPVLSFVMLCHMLRHWSELSRLQRASMFAHASMVVALAFGLSGAVSTLGTRDMATVSQLQASLLTKVDFGLRPDAFSALARSSVDSYTTLMPWYWGKNRHSLLAPKAWLAVLPSVLFLVRYASNEILRLPIQTWARWLLWAAMFATIAAPQTLNLVGWDWNRWNAISVIGCFTCITATKVFFPGTLPPLRSPGPLLIGGLIAVVLSLAADTPLFDEFQVQFFPFDEQVKFIMNLLDPAFKYRPVM